MGIRGREYMGKMRQSAGHSACAAALALLLIFTALLGCLTGCAGPASLLAEKDVSGTYVVGEDTLPYTDDELYEMLFDIHNKVEVDIDISEEQLALMQQDHEEYDWNGKKSPIYRMADLSITITSDTSTCTYVIKECGVRMKGNTSRCSFYDEEKGIYKLINLKLDLQDRTFAGLEKLEMKWNKNDDSTYVREYYAYEMFRAYGVPAQHMNLASTDFGGVHEGVFYLYEAVDQVFLARYYSEDRCGGNLYKVGWCGDKNGNFRDTSSIGVEDEGQGIFYAYDLKTNKKDADYSDLKAVINAVKNGKATEEELEALLDKDTFLRYAAVSYYVGNPDDLRYNYNNSFLYFFADTGRMIVIPYDTDRCFGITKDWNPDGCAMTGKNPTERDTECELFLTTVCAGGVWEEEYMDLIEEIADSDWMSYDHFKEYYDLAYEHYGDETQPDYTMENAENHHFAFDLARDAGTGSWEDNCGIETYLEDKLSQVR